VPPLPLELGLPLAGTAPCFAVGGMLELDAEDSALYSLTYTAEEKQCAHVVVRFSHYKISYKHMMTCAFFDIQRDEEMGDPQIETTDLTTRKIKSVKPTLYTHLS
jgi:hypothetical protein